MVHSDETCHHYILLQSVYDKIENEIKNVGRNTTIIFDSSGLSNRESMSPIIVLSIEEYPHPDDHTKITTDTLGFVSTHPFIFSKFVLFNAFSDVAKICKNKKNKKNKRRSNKVREYSVGKFKATPQMFNTDTVHRHSHP